MATTSDIRKGMCINYNHDIYKIIEFLHVKPGKGPAFVRTKLKSVTNGKVVDNTFSAGHKIDEVTVRTMSYQYLYPEGENMHFMNNDDYTQIMISQDLVDNYQFLKEGESVMVILKEDDQTPLSVEMPASVILEVTEADPAVKGNTATNATKNAVLETGAKIQVPLFIEPGEKIKINPEDGSYLERVKD